MQCVFAKLARYSLFGVCIGVIILSGCQLQSQQYSEEELALIEEAKGVAESVFDLRTVEDVDEVDWSAVKDYYIEYNGDGSVYASHWSDDVDDAVWRSNDHNSGGYVKTYDLLSQKLTQPGGEPRVELIYRVHKGNGRVRKEKLELWHSDHADQFVIARHWFNI